MKVYRLEDSTGDGPYSSWKGELNTKLCKDHMNPEHHPTVSRAQMRWGEGWYSGCRSMEQLREWFGSFLPKLIDAGYRLVVYEVDDYWVDISKFQVTFRKDRGTCLYIHPKTCSSA